MTTFPDKHDQELIDAITSLKTKKETQSFLRDLLTTSEIKEASNRFQIAKHLWLGEKSYLQIAKECNTSTTTVTRVNDWLQKQGHNGYKVALKRLFPHSK